MPDQPRQPRPPHNLQGLLRFAVEATRSEDAPAGAEPAPIMDAERRRFLEEALASMTVNVVNQLERAAAVLTADDADESAQLDALECLIDYVDSMDTANDFCKIGGLDILLPLLRCPTTGDQRPVRSATVRLQGAALVAELAQNNPFCQQQLLERDALRVLLPMLANATTAVAAMRAISACVRAYEPAAAAFIEMGGLECALGCLQTAAGEKMVVQSLFLLRAMCGEFEGVKNELIKLNAIEPICARLRPSTEYNAALEAALSTLAMLTEPNVSAAGDDSRAVAAHAYTQCHQPALGMHAVLSEIVRTGSGKDECQEAVDFARVLLQRLFATDPTADAGQVDR